MNLREYAEQAVPLLQAVLEGKQLEARPRLGSPDFNPAWLPIEVEGRQFQYLNFDQFEIRVKAEWPESVLVHVHRDGSLGSAYGPNDFVPRHEWPSRMVRYVREDLVPKDHEGAAGLDPAAIREAKIAADEQYSQDETLAVDQQPVDDPVEPPLTPTLTAPITTDWGTVSVSGSVQAVVDAIETIGRGRGRG